MEKFFFDSWASIFRTFTISIGAYFGLILLLRISGKRTLSKMNAFDFIVTVALGSTLAAVILNKNVALADGLLGLALLILFQYIITKLSVKSENISNLVKSTPSLLFYKGKYLHEPMQKERVTQQEIIAAIRQSGADSLDSIDAVILETDGSLSIIKNISGDDKILSGVKK